MDQKNKNYTHALVYRPPDANQPYLWHKYNKYRSLEAAQMAYDDKMKSPVQDWLFKIVPYFNGGWWQDDELERKEYMEANKMLWAFIESKNLKDECYKFIGVKQKKFIFW